ncbi:hypothetical protein IRJ41_022594 [Triplophysa rosa]|uniref:Uncharacterized protein n=1 Tax=Triplophysa rosa TaxID=992332 RepID=A0A9W7X1X2_TRIRA|nr:hypothetical protein IRJ41_022594 [Triplophysa rosa]
MNNTAKDRQARMCEKIEKERQRDRIFVVYFGLFGLVDCCSRTGSKERQKIRSRIDQIRSALQVTVIWCRSGGFSAEEIYCSRSCEWDGSGPPPGKPLRRAGGVQCLKSCFQRWRLNERASVPHAPR